MADIKQYTDQIANAVYGEEVRGSIINALNKVNDDNNSYAQIKSDVVAAKDDVSAQVAAFDQKVANAQSATTALTNATNTANTTKENLDASVSAANTAKTNVDSSTSKANTAKSNVDAAVSTANQTITNANTAKSNLDSSIENASTAQSNVQSTINTANATNTTLKDATATASTVNSNLNGTISSANSAKTSLQDTINNSNTAKSNLSGVITQSAKSQQDLNTAVSVANDALQSLSSENASAKSNVEELRGENFNSQEILSGVADLRAYLGLYDSDVVGVQVDYKNKTYKRLGAASGLNGGSDFDQFPMFGGRKRCNVANDGTINAWYGDSAYKEDGSNGQVMVYQPAFWYLVAPVEYEKQATGVGYHLRKANYYVSGKARAGFRLHPAFFDASGNEVDHIFFSAFRGSIYDTSAKAYIKDDAQVCDAGTDLFCSISGVKPASGYNQNLTRTSIEQMAQNRGTGWHGDTIKATSANQLLMLIEYAGNLQTAIERGVVDIPWTGLASDDTSSYAVNTGGTSGLGNATGHADSSTQQINGQTLTNTTNGKRSISYRGMEDPWGNMWDFVYGLNFYYESGKPFLGYVCKDFNFAESKQTDNYESIGFTLPSENGYISAMGYSTKFDWLFLPSEVKGDSALPIGDYYYQNNTCNGYRIALLGGAWRNGVSAGGFCWLVDGGVGYRYRSIGGRLVYVPTAKA
jgi:predicted  nucleic acid-binding Zn-ribbon protein